MQPNQANVEYFYRLVYECLRGKCYGSVDTTSFSSFLAHLWLIIIVLGYVLAVAALLVIVYALVRLFELRKKEEEYYGTLLVAPEHEGAINPRWTHIESLIATENPNDWRAAIVEADIMLDDMLTRQGYPGDGVGEKLKNVERSDFNTLQDAWEAHKVRNQIAHEGAGFDLSGVLARRTIAQYENVFREFHLI